MDTRPEHQCGYIWAWQVRLLDLPNLPQQYPDPEQLRQQLEYYRDETTELLDQLKAALAQWEAHTEEIKKSVGWAYDTH